MRFRSLIEAYVSRRNADHARHARRRQLDELFPQLTLFRLEERRLLNAAPVAVAPQTLSQDDQTNTATAVANPDDGDAGGDVSNLAVEMYGGPANGQLTAQMQEQAPAAADDQDATTTTDSPAPQLQSQVIDQSGLAANMPPVNTVPGPQVTNEDAPLVIHGLAMSDSDAGNAPIVTRFEVAHGTLSIDTSQPGTVILPGGTVQLGNGATVLGNQSGILQILGTIPQINEVLGQGLTYTPAHDYYGADSLKMVTNDLGSFGSGGAMTDTDFIAITVNAVNDPPVNTVPGPQVTNEDTTLLITGLAVSDVDATNSPITTRFEVGHGTLNIDTSMPGTVVLPGGTVQLGNGATVLGNGTATLQILGTTAQINQALAPGLSYAPTHDYYGADSLKMVTNDLGAFGAGGPLLDTDFVAITVNAVNDAPVNTVPGPQVTNEDTPLLISGLAVSDVDAGSSPIVSRFEVAHGTLSVDTSMPGTVVLPGGTVQLGNGATVLGNGTAVLQILGTVAQINQALAPGLSYAPTHDYYGSDSLKIVTNDLGAFGAGGPLTDTDFVAITVNAVNDAPTNTVPPSQSTNEDTPLLITGLAVADVDAGSSPITTQFDVAHGSLNVDTSLPGTVILPGGTVQFGNGATATGNGTGTLQILGTVAQINAVLALGLTYTPAQDFNGADSLTMLTDDQGAFGLGGPLTDTDVVAITVNAVDDAPVNIVPGSQSTNEDTPLVITGLAVSDVDAGNSPITTQFTVAHGTLNIDTSLPGTVILPGGNVQFANGATAAGNGTGTLQILGTVAQINAVLALGLTYTPAQDFNGADSLQMLTDDQGAVGLGGPLTDTDVVTITVNAVDDAPTNTVPGAQSTNEDTPLVISGLAVSDIDSGSTPIVTQFAVAHGTLTVDTSMPGTIILPGGTVQLGNGATVQGNGSGTLEILGTVTQINEVLALGLTYTPAQDFNGADSLQMLTNDQGAIGLGGPLTDTDFVAITVNAVNDAPVNTVPGAQATNEDTTLLITGLAVNDVDAINSPIVSRFEVAHGVLNIDTSMPGTVILPGGTVQLGNGATVLGNGTGTLQILGTVAQINQALAPGLSYSPTHDYYGLDSLKMVTNDLGAFGAGGPQSDTDIVAINVNPVNDAPINTVPGSQTTNEDHSTVIGGLAVSDVDAGNSPIVTRFEVAQGTLNIDTSMPGTVILPGGTVQLGNGATVLGNGTSVLQILGTVAQINQALAPGLTYSPTPDFYGADSLKMVTNDLGAFGAGGPLTDTDLVAITVNPVVLPPTLTIAATPVEGFNGLPIPLGISGALTDVNKPAEVLTFNLSNVPTDAILHDGLGVDHTGQAAYTFTAAEILGMTITLPDSRILRTFDITVVAVATDPTIAIPENSTASSAPGTVTVISRNPYPVIENVVATDTVEGSQTTLTADISSLRATNFTVVINWGDGTTQTIPLSFAVGEQSTTLTLQHTYLDNNPGHRPDGKTLVQISVTDSFNKNTTTETLLTVANVPPKVTGLNITPTELNEGQTAQLTGTFTDPGIQDTFTLSVDWGDQTPPQIISLPAGTTSFSLSHLYADDNPTGSSTDLNQVVVTVLDKDGGQGSSQIGIRVDNVAPTLANFFGTKVTSDGNATVSGVISDPGKDVLTLTINWGDSVQVVTGIAQGAFSIEHHYVQSPNADPSAPIAITLSLADDDRGVVGNGYSAEVPGLGPTGGAEALFYVYQHTDIQHFTSDTTKVELAAAPPVVLSFTTVQFDPRGPQGDVVGSTKPVVALRAVDAAKSTERGIVLLPVDVLNNLSTLFTKLPDDHYRLYYVEGGTERLIMDVIVRRGKPIDPTDDSEGTQDRPPTSFQDAPIEQDDSDGQPQAADEPPAAEASDEPAVEVSQLPAIVSPSSEMLSKEMLASEVLAGVPADASPTIVVAQHNQPSTVSHKYRHLFAPAMAAVAATVAWQDGSWKNQVDEHFAQPDARGWTKVARLKRLLRRAHDENSLPQQPR